MSWYAKESPTPFDTTPIDGLFFLHGDILAKVIQQEWAKGMKYPMVDFPSGITFEVWDTWTETVTPIVHLFGEMDLSFYTTQSEALAQAKTIAEQVRYKVMAKGDNQLESSVMTWMNIFYLHLTMHWVVL